MDDDQRADRQDNPATQDGREGPPTPGGTIWARVMGARVPEERKGTGPDDPERRQSAPSSTMVVGNG